MNIDGVVNKDSIRNVTEAYLPNHYNNCHAADLLELENKDLLCCWFAGTREGNSDISIVMSRLKYGSNQWSEPIKISDDETKSEQNPSLFLDKEGTIWVVYTAQQARTNELGMHKNLQYTATIRCKKSYDNGYTWGKTETLFSEPGSFCRQKIQRLSNERLLFGNWICHNDDTHNASDISVVRISDDGGSSWRKVEIPHSTGLVHCNLVECRPGKVLAFFRSRFADNIYMSNSDDYGETWSIPKKTELPNNNASISAIRLQDGNLGIVYNSCGYISKSSEAVWPRLRAPIVIAISDNEGESWDYRRVIEYSEGYCGRKNSINNNRYEYPVIIQTNDQQLYIAYTYQNRRCIKVVSFDTSWVVGSQSINEGMQFIF